MKFHASVCLCSEIALQLHYWQSSMEEDKVPLWEKPLQSCCFSYWKHSTHALYMMGRPFSIPSCGAPWWQCGHWRPVTSPPCCSEWKSISNWLDYDRLRWVSCAPLKNFSSPGSVGAIHVEKLKALRSEMTLLKPGAGSKPALPTFPKAGGREHCSKDQKWKGRSERKQKQLTKNIKN